MDWTAAGSSRPAHGGRSAEPPGATVGSWPSSTGSWDRSKRSRTADSSRWEGPGNACCSRCCSCTPTRSFPRLADRRRLGRRTAGDRVEHRPGLRIRSAPRAGTRGDRDARSGLRDLRGARRSRPPPLRAARRGGDRSARRRPAARGGKDATRGARALARTRAGRSCRRVLREPRGRAPGGTPAGRPREKDRQRSRVRSSRGGRRRARGPRRRASTPRVVPGTTHAGPVPLRQAGDALDSFRTARAILADELGIDPGLALQRLEQAILAQDASPTSPRPDTMGSWSGSRRNGSCSSLPRRIGYHASRGSWRGPRPTTGVRADRREPRSCRGRPGNRDRTPERHASHARRSRDRRSSGPFISTRAGEDVVRLASEQDVALTIVEAAPSLLQEGVPDRDLTVVLAQAPCDVALLVTKPPNPDGPVVVPFGGADHDWAAVELGAWLAKGRGAPLRLVGATAVPMRGSETRAGSCSTHRWRFSGPSA